jgi:hypothetical protein
MSKFKVGDHISSSSGLVYIIVSVKALDDHGSTAYRARRLRGGIPYGPSRLFAECDVSPSRWSKDTDGFVYDPDKMFPSVLDCHRMTD